MVKDHSDSEKETLYICYSFLLAARGHLNFYMHHPTERIIHTMAFVTPVVELWMEYKIAQWVHHEGWANALTIKLYLAPTLIRVVKREVEKRCLEGKYEQEERKDIFFYFTTHSAHFIYGYMASDIW